MTKSKHCCSERVFTGDRMDIGGHPCGVSATVLENDQWWCRRHSKAGLRRARHKAKARRLAVRNRDPVQ